MISFESSLHHLLSLSVRW